MPAADRNKALGLVLAVGIACGAALQRLTVLLSSTDIGGPGWSLRGNGALIVLFGGMAMLLAGGWTFLARRTWPRAILAGGLALVLELAITFGPIVAGPDA